MTHQLLKACGLYSKTSRFGTVVMTDQLLKACGLYSKTSRGAGNREYLVGYLGGMKILIFKVHDPQAAGPTHSLFFTARPPRQERPPAHDAQRGATTAAAVDESGTVWSRERRGAQVQETRPPLRRARARRGALVMPPIMSARFSKERRARPLTERYRFMISLTCEQETAHRP
jgi:hypothetical protein